MVLGRGGNHVSNVFIIFFFKLKLNMTKCYGLIKLNNEYMGGCYFLFLSLGLIYFIKMA